MKKALKLLLLYLGIIVIGIGVGSFLYSIYLSVLNSVTGRKIDFFEINTYLKSLFYIASCVLILVFPLLSFSHIRQSRGISKLITYIILALVTWLIALPAVMHYGKNFNYNSSQYDFEQSVLAPNIFRKVGDNVYFFADDSASTNKTANTNDQTESSKMLTAVIINTNQYGKVITEQRSDFKNLNLYLEARPYRDILIKESFSGNTLHQFIDFHFIISRAEQACQKRFTFLLGFLSFAFVLCSLYGVSALFQWKLMNVGMIFTSTIVILFVNSTCIQLPVIYSVIEKINSIKFFAFLSNYIDDPFIVLLNIIFGIIFIVIGIIQFAKNKKKIKNV